MLHGHLALFFIAIFCFIIIFLVCVSLFSIFIRFHGSSCDFMGFHGSSWVFMGFHGSSWVFMGFHGSSWMFMGLHGVSCDISVFLCF